MLDDKSLNINTESKVDRPLYNKIVARISNGDKITWEDLDRDTLKTLCIDELCIDPVIGALFNVDHRYVRSLRMLYGFTDEKIVNKLKEIEVKEKYFETM